MPNYPGSLDAFTTAINGVTIVDAADRNNVQNSIIGLEQYGYPVYNVRTYGGATGNGTTNDTVAIQNTVNAAAATGQGAMVVIPYGTYLINATILVPGNIQLYIYGNMNMANAANQSFIQVTGNNVVIAGSGTLDGNRANQTTFGAGIVTNTGISNLRIDGLTIQNQYYWPISLGSVTNAWVTNCRLLNSGSASQFSINCYNCWASNLYISGCADYGWCFYGGPQRCGLTNSYITNCTPNCGVLSDTGQTAPCYDIVIANNVFNQDTNSLVNRAGVYVANNTGNVNGTHKSITITGNIIRGGTSYANSTAMLLTGGQKIVVSDNVIHDIQSINAMKVDSSWIRIDNNEIYNVAVGGSGGVAINITANASYTMIEHNSIFDDQGSPTTASAVADAGAYTIIRDNWTQGLTGTAFPAPTLGALQTNISAQSISGTDQRGIITLTTGGSGPGAGATLAVVNFHRTYLSVPTVQVSTEVATATFDTGGGNLYAVSATGFTVQNGTVAQGAGQTIKIHYTVTG